MGRIPVDGAGVTAVLDTASGVDRVHRSDRFLESGYDGEGKRSGEVDKFAQWSPCIVISRTYVFQSQVGRVRPSLTSEGASRFPPWESELRLEST